MHNTNCLSSNNENTTISGVYSCYFIMIVLHQIAAKVLCAQTLSGYKPFLDLLKFETSYFT